MAWREFAFTMERDAAAAVRDLDADVLFSSLRGCGSCRPGGPLDRVSSGAGASRKAASEIRGRSRSARQPIAARYRDVMAVVVVFRCDICGARPDPETQCSLEHQLLDLRHGEYVDAEPGRWLTWHGRGIYGPHRYACGEHRGELKALLREHYGTLGGTPGRSARPWAGRRGTDRARRLSRALRSTMGPAGS